MKRVITAAILIPIVLVLVFLAPHWLFTLAVALVASFAGWEYMGLAEKSSVRPPRVAVVIALVALFAINFQWPDHTAAFFVAVSLGLLVYCTFMRPVTEVLPDAAVSMFCLVYAGFTLLALPTLHNESNGPSLVVFLLLVVWAGDVAAYYAGRAWGRRKLAPEISPGKTWEGAIASVAGSVLIAAALVGLSALQQEPWNSVVLSWLERACPSAILSYPDDLWYWLVLAVVVNVAAQVGDLAESALKRSAGVKDSGTILPGHGGVLDRIDALLLAAPALWYAQVIHQAL
jgi:phosphatidate cytidylyltransferase